MRKGVWVVFVLAAWTLASCELDDVYVDDFLNDMTINQGGDPEPFCGDGRVDPGEQCDDGNTWDWDGCSSWCTVELDGCYDEYGMYHFPGEEWSYEENSACMCYGWGEIDCRGWDIDYPDNGCVVNGGYYYPGDIVFMEDENSCVCIGDNSLDCGGDVIVVI